MDRPDNAAGWDQLADAYQHEVGWPDDHLAWGLRCPAEEELGLVSDVVRGARTVVVGCGGGQDIVALARLGAGPLIGVDPSTRQLDHARRRLEAAGIEAKLVVGAGEDLAALPDASADLVVSVQAFNYVAYADVLAAELRRVLVPGGVVAFSVLHPADMSTAEDAPYDWVASWFTVERDWDWDDLADATVRFRSWYRSASDWFTALTDGGLVVDRLLEPAPVEDRRWIERGWLDRASYDKLEVVPGTILVRAHRPT